MPENLISTVFVNSIFAKSYQKLPNKYLTKWHFMCFNKNRKDENEMIETNEKIFELLNDQFEEMIADEDAWGYDFAEVYHVLQSKDIERAKQILTELNVEY